MIMRGAFGCFAFFLKKVGEMLAYMRTIFYLCRVIKNKTINT